MLPSIFRILDIVVRRRCFRSINTKPDTILFSSNGLFPIVVVAYLPREESSFD